MASRENKSVYRYIGEAVLVFASVLGALWVEDYRHHKQKYEDYMDALISFRNRVHADIYIFQMPNDTSIGGFIPPAINSIDTILLRVENNELVEAKEGILQSVFRWAKWRYPSRSSIILSNYPKYLNSDNVSVSIENYESFFSRQNLNFDYLNEKITRLRVYCMTTKTGDLDPSVMKELVVDYRTELVNMQKQDSIIVDNFISLVNQLDSILAKRGADTTALNKTFLD
ncbi:MAG: hypothetical protein HRT61_10115 [Ekhidna sp.]|nr:hypothetical protein [Ekhidna sp.]